MYCVTMADGGIHKKITSLESLASVSLEMALTQTGLLLHSASSHPTDSSSVDGNF